MRRLLSTSAIALAGCISIPDAAIVDDLRILEIRVDPPEIPVFKPAPPISRPEDLLELEPNDVTVEVAALVAHPDLDAKIAYEWVRCKPGLDRVPCDGMDRERLASSETSSVAAIAPVSILFADAIQAAMMSQGGDRAGRAVFGALGTIASDPRDLLNGLYAYVNVHASVISAAIHADTSALDGTKRLVVFDPQIVRVAISVARSQTLPQIEGYSLPNLCSTVSAEQVDLIYDFLEKRAPNRAPAYRRIEIVEVNGSTGTFRDLMPGEILRLSPGESIALRGHADPGDKEEFQLIDDNCQLQDLHEVLAWSWFTNLGELSSRLTTESIEDEAEDSSRHRVTYTAPPAAGLKNQTNRARIWSILRDGRGGSASRIIEVQIER
jgi:hypothetical protein